MANTCPSCGSQIPQDFRFCGFCGEAVEVSHPINLTGIKFEESRGSRRFVTVLFADMTNYTRAAEGADPEIVFHAIRTVLERLAQVIKKYGGRVDRYYGDGFLAIFGVPEAIEDDQQRALLAALEMQALMKEHQLDALQDLNWDMRLRIGVNVGRVVSGQLDTGTIFDSSVFGHTVNLANRLQASARPGTVLVTEQVYRKMRLRFNFQAPVKLQLRGIDKPVVAYELIRVRADPEPMRGLAGRQAPLIGRDQEYELLITHLENLVIDHRGAVAFITGDAGVGKSRLVDEILLPENEVFRVVRTQSSAFESTGYAALRDILRSLAGVTSDDGVVSQQEQLAEFLSQIDDIGADVAPIFEDIIFGRSSVEQRDRDPHGHQRSMIVAFRRLLTRLSKQIPMAILFDDIQWADASSMEVISHLVDLTVEIPLALIFVGRSEYREELLGSLLETHSPKGLLFIDIQLEALSYEECEHLVESLLSEVDLPTSLKQSIYERTAGNPLFTEELIRIFLDQEIIHRKNGTWVLIDSWREFIEKVPETVNGLLLSRYDRQPDHLKIILDAASILGYSFHLNLLSLILSIPDLEFRRDIGALVEADFVRRSSGVGSPVCTFRHALMQEAIYETILLEDRRRLHRKVADVLINVAEDYYVDADAIIGHHLELCGSEEAVSYLLSAAKQAAERYANDEAILYFNRVLKLIDGKGIRKEYVDASIGIGEVLNRTGESQHVLGRLKEIRDYPNSHVLSEYRRGDIFYQLGLASYSTGNLDDAIDNFELAAFALKKNESECRSFRQSDIDREIGWALFLKGEQEEALTRAESALSLAKQEGRSDAEGSAHKLLASIFFKKGQMQNAVANAESSLSIREKVGDVWGAASSQTTLGYFYHQIGQWSLAEKMLRQAIYVQGEVGDYNNLAGSWTNLGLLLMDKGQFNEALECINESINILPGHEFPIVRVIVYYLDRGLVHLRLGNADEAIDDFKRALEDAQTQSNDDLIALAYAYLAEGYLRKGSITEAKQVIEKSLALIGEATSSEFKSDVYRVKAYISCAQGEFEEAYQRNLEAHNLIGEIGNRYEQARLLVDKAEIYLADSEQRLASDDMVAELETALEIFQQMDAKAEISRVEECLFRIIADQVDDGEEIDSSLRYPVVLVAIQLLQPSKVQEHFEGVVSAKKRLIKELKSIAEKENVFLTATQPGFTLVLSNAYPQAMDRMSLSAVDAAHLAIMSCIRLNRTHLRNYGYEFRMKVGIVAGSSNELISNQEQAALFSSVSQSGRQANLLAELARDYQVLITGEMPSAIQSTYELDLLAQVKDPRLSQFVYSLGEALSGSDVDGKLPQSSLQLIGRDAELMALCDRIDGMKSRGKGFVSFVEAEAGMGKTRLLAAVMKTADQGVLYLKGKCETFRSNISYWPLVEILEKNAFPDSPEYLRLKSMLDMRPLEEADETLLGNLPPDAVRKEIFSSVRDFILSQIGQHPMILVFEDVHFIDLSSLELLDYLLSIISEAPVSLILISRSEMPGPHRSFVKKVERVCQEDYLHVRFSELTKDQSLDLVRNLLGADVLPADLEDLLTPFFGHPLSIEEAIRFLVERRWLRRLDNAWLLTDLSDSNMGQMPTTFRDLLLRRLNYLDDESLHVLQAAALLGEVFDRITLNRMISGSTLAQRLTALYEKGWLRKLGSENPSLYHFNHTLTRETIYSTLVRSKKQLLHQRAGEAIESLYPESQEENLEILAYHFENSGLLDKSLYYAIRAAEKCARRFALEESRRYYRKAEEILSQRYQPQTRMMTRVVIGLADVYLSLGEPGKVVDSVQKLLSESGNLSITLQAACLRRLGAALHMQGDLPTALEKYGRALETINSAKDPEMKLGRKIVVSGDEERIDIQIGLSRVYFDMHRHFDAKEHAQRALALFDFERYTEKAAHLNNLLAGISYRENDIDEALRLSKRALAIYQANGFRDGTSDTYSNMGILSVALGDYNSALDHFSLSLELHQALGDVEGIAITRNNLGQLETTRGYLVEAISHLRFSIQYARVSELTRTLTQAIANLGYTLTVAGELDQALDTLVEAENLCGTHRYGDLLGEVLWKKAECLIALDDIDTAIETAIYALDQAGELKRRDIEAQSMRVYARALRKRGDFADARDLAREAWQFVAEDSDAHKRAHFAVEYGLALDAKMQRAEASDLIKRHVRGVRIVEPEHILREFAESFSDLADSEPA